MNTLRLLIAEWIMQIPLWIMPEGEDRFTYAQHIKEYMEEMIEARKHWLYR